ncbi:hypothetical protein AVEN_148775-1 [Araneus ventricosus]|uniref:Uncharacterized protein n=1 Tax=Araneus ventricosus TaxID=182803 RepID=A0A4Y2QZA0_ARAVE|nr:hypothetical protein AVEN_148775-1 [Araneus ventricosus]
MNAHLRELNHRKHCEDDWWFCRYVSAHDSPMIHYTPVFSFAKAKNRLRKYFSVWLQFLFIGGIFDGTNRLCEKDKLFVNVLFIFKAAVRSLGRFLIGSLPIAVILMARLPKNFCISLPIMSPRTKNHLSFKIYNALHMLSCEHDNEQFWLDFNRRGYVVRTVETAEFVDELSSSKGLEMVGDSKSSFPHNFLTIEDRKKILIRRIIA